VAWNLPMVWIMGFLVVFVCGGLTGVMLALVPFNWQVHDTHFVVAHMHYVMVGGMLFPVLAALYYWLPHLSGRMASQRLGYWGFWLFFIGFNMTFLLMHLTGLEGMPRRVYTYEAGLGWDWLNLLSSVGGFVMAGGVAMIIIDVALHYRFGRRSPANPWNADTLEWATSLPPAPYNFVSLPTLNSRHPLWDQPDLPETMAAGQHGLATMAHGRRETLGTDALHGKPREIIHLPTNSWLPLLGALALAVVCISLLLRAYPAALFGVALAAALFLRWSWENGVHLKAAPLADDEPDDLPLHSRSCDGPGLWGMVVSLLANGALYLSLLFAWFYLWTASPGWRVPDERAVALLPFLAAGALLSIVMALYHRAAIRAVQGDAEGLGTRLWQISALGVVHWGLLAWVLYDAALAPTELAHDAVLLVMLLYLLIHSALAVVLTVLQALRVGYGYVGARLPYELLVLRPFWIYTLGVFWLSFAAFLLLPMAWGGQ